MPFDKQIIMAKVSRALLKDIIEARVAGSRHGFRVIGVNILCSKKLEYNDRVTFLEV